MLKNCPQIVRAYTIFELIEMWPTLFNQMQLGKRIFYSFIGRNQQGQSNRIMKWQKTNLFQQIHIKTDAFQWKKCTPKQNQVQRVNPQTQK